MSMFYEITDSIILGKTDRSSRPPKIAGRAVLIDKDGNIALMHVKAKSSYTFPGGGIELGESILECTKRELYEETGCTCDILCEIGCIKENRAQHDITMESYFYLSSVIGSKGEMHLDPGEIENQNEVIWVSADECNRLLHEQKPINYQFTYIKARDVAIIDYLKTSNDESAQLFRKLAERL